MQLTKATFTVIAGANRLLWEGTVLTAPREPAQSIPTMTRPKVQTAVNIHRLTRNFVASPCESRKRPYQNVGNLLSGQPEVNSTGLAD